MQIRKLIMAALFLSSVVAAPLAAKDKLISQSMVEEKGPIAFKVAKLGEFELVSLSQTAKAGVECFTTLEAVGKRVSDAHEAGDLRLEPGRSAALGLALTTCPDEGGEVLCCMGAGSDCEISVNVRSVY